MSESLIAYFGYGATREAESMAAILGRSPNEMVGQPAILEGYSLVIQGLEQIPDTISPTAPVPISPRTILRAQWGDHFKSYALKADPNGRVSGVIWELTPEQKARMADWELSESGWFQNAEGEAIAPEGQKIRVALEVIGPDQDAEVVDGMNYETWLIDSERFKVVAEKVRRDYDERLASAEGSTSDPERK